MVLIRYNTCIIVFIFIVCHVDISMGRIRAPRQVNDIITAYMNGSIYTVDTASNPDWDVHPAEALVTENKKIIFVGSTIGAEQLLEDIYNNRPGGYTFVVYDLYGSVVLPGLHDIHMHPLEAGSEVGGTCKLPGNTDPDSEEIRLVLQDCAPKQYGTEWVLGAGHSITNLLDYIKQTGGMPKHILDEIIPNKPVILLEETSHSVWVNSLALQRAGIDSKTPVRPGGVIMRSSDGEPNGVLLENEGLAIMDMALDIKKYPTLETYNYEGLEFSLSEISKNGITSICDARMYWKRGHNTTWQQACDAGIINTRVILDLWVYPHTDSDSLQIQALKDMHSYSEDNCLMKKSQVKVYSDGLLDSYTAALLEPYASNLEGLPGLEANVGLNYFTQERLAKYIQELQYFVDRDGVERGFDFNVHAIGDRGIHETLNAIEMNADSNTRHRITHVELIDSEDVPRFNKLNVIADFQVAGTFTLPTPHNVQHYKYLVGERTRNFIAVNLLRDNKARTTFSSDWDVSPMNPFNAIQNAQNRGDQSVDAKTAIEMYTIHPAYAMRQENIVGSLVPGKEADLIIVDQDILKPLSMSKDIKDTTVLQTVLQGKPVYTHSKFQEFILDNSGEWNTSY